MKNRRDMVNYFTGGFVPPSVQSLPDPSTVPVGSMVLYDKFPRVSALPSTVVNGMSYVLASASRNVVELTADEITIQKTSRYRESSLEFTFRDVTAGASGTSIIAYSRGFGTTDYAMQVFANSSGYANIAMYKKGNVTAGSATLPINVCDGYFHTIKLDLQIDGFRLIVDEVASGKTLYTGASDDYWSDIQSVRISSAAAMNPLQVCNIVQSLNGTIIDTIPCDDGATKTTLRNLTSPSRTATLSDATAWATTTAPILPELQTEHLGRNLAELNGPDTISVPFPPNMKTNDWEIVETIQDMGATSGVIAAFQIFKNGASDILYFRLSAAGYFEVSFRKDDGAALVTFSVSSSPDLNLKRFTCSVKKVGLSVTSTVYVDGATYTASIANIDGYGTPWNGNGITSCVIKDDNSYIRPLQVCNIIQSINGVVIDNIPCDDAAGTTVLRNTVSPARTATLSDATAHALAWVAQSGKTKAVWKYRTVGVFENDFILAPDSIWKNDEATDIEMLLYLDFSSANNSKLISQLIVGAMNIAFNGTQLKYDIYAAGSSQIGSITPSCWRRIRFSTNASKDLSVYLDGVLFASFSALSSWSANPGVGWFKLFGGDIRSKGKIAFASKTGTGPFLYDFTEGSGSTVVNRLNPGTNNGAITDGAPVTFWSYDWVPLT